MWVGIVAVGLFLVGTSASAAPIAVLGGIDLNSQYTGFNCSSDPNCQGQSGVFTFNDTFNSINTPEAGTVTSTGGAAPGSLIGANVDFDVTLSGTGSNGNAFDPATSNIRNARFDGGSGAEFVIYTGSGINQVTLLAFDVDFIDVSNFTTTKINPAVDPDGSFTLGSFNGNSFAGVGGSNLVIVGGTLNQTVGGVGTKAVLQVQALTLTPSLTGGKGYFNQNILIGFGPQPVSTTVWDLTIIPEPGTASLLGIGLVAVIALARRAPRRR